MRALKFKVQEAPLTLTAALNVNLQGVARNPIKKWNLQIIEDQTLKICEGNRA